MAIATAIIATIGVTITYLFISENKVSNYINNIFDDNENDENDKKVNEKFVQFDQPIKYNQYMEPNMEPTP